MTEREKMLRGEQFETLDPQLSEDRRRAAALLSRLNALSMDAPGYREALGELLPHASDECLIRPPFFTATMVTACSSDVAFSLTSTA